MILGRNKDDGDDDHDDDGDNDDAYKTITTNY